MSRSKLQNYSNSLWFHVAKSIGSRVGGGGRKTKPRYGPSPFSLIRSLLLKDLSFIFIPYLDNAVILVMYHLCIIWLPLHKDSAWLLKTTQLSIRDIQLMTFKW